MSYELFPDDEMLEIFEANFYKEAQLFKAAKYQDERDAHMNKDFVAKRELAAGKVNALLDAYLDIKGNAAVML